MDTYTSKELHDKQPLNIAETVFRRYNPDFCYSDNHKWHCVRVIGINPEDLKAIDYDTVFSCGFDSDDDGFYTHDYYIFKD